MTHRNPFGSDERFELVLGRVAGGPLITARAFNTPGRDRRRLSVGFD